jgi:hypothetical protein
MLLCPLPGTTTAQNASHSLNVDTPQQSNNFMPTKEKKIKEKGERSLKVK